MASIQQQVPHYELRPDIALQVRALFERTEQLVGHIVFTGEWSQAAAMQLRPVVSATEAGFTPGYEVACRLADRSLALHTFGNEAVGDLQAAQAMAASMVHARRTEILTCPQPPALPACEC